MSKLKEAAVDYCEGDEGVAFEVVAKIFGLNVYKRTWEEAEYRFVRNGRQDLLRRYNRVINPKDGGRLSLRTGWAEFNRRFLEQIEVGNPDALKMFPKIRTRNPDAD